MCPACIASAAATVAGAGSVGGMLALCIAKCKKYFRMKSSSQWQKIEEK